MATVEVTGIAHIYVSVRNLARSAAFYDLVMAPMGFKRSSGPLGGIGDIHVHYFNRCTQYTLRPARPQSGPFDSSSTRLHHLCFYVDADAEIDQLARAFADAGVDVSEPRLYPEYEEGYYAIFFDDPDGIRLEVRSMNNLRRESAEFWDRVPHGYE